MSDLFSAGTYVLPQRVYHDPNSYGFRDILQAKTDAALSIRPTPLPSISFVINPFKILVFS